MCHGRDVAGLWHLLPTLPQLCSEPNRSLPALLPLELSISCLQEAAKTLIIFAFLCISTDWHTPSLAVQDVEGLAARGSYAEETLRWVFHRREHKVRSPSSSCHNYLQVTQ